MLLMVGEGKPFKNHTSHRKRLLWILGLNKGSNTELYPCYPCSRHFQCTVTSVRMSFACLLYLRAFGKDCLRKHQHGNMAIQLSHVLSHVLNGHSCAHDTSLRCWWTKAQRILNSPAADRWWTSWFRGVTATVHQRPLLARCVEDQPKRQWCFMVFYLWSYLWSDLFWVFGVTLNPELAASEQ